MLFAQPNSLESKMIHLWRGSCTEANISVELGIRHGPAPTEVLAPDLNQWRGPEPQAVCTAYRDIRYSFGLLARSTASLYRISVPDCIAQ
jgi:hypothetical protein